MLDHDPLAKLLLARWRLTPLQLAVVGLAVECVTRLSQVAYGLTTSRPSAQWPFVNWGDWDLFLINILLSVVVTPAVWMLYGWSVNSIPSLLSGLDQSGLFPDRPEGVAATILQPRSDPLASWLWPIVALLVAVLCSWHWIAQFAAQEGAFLLIQLPTWFIAWYMLSMVITREVRLVQVLRRYFAVAPLELHPLHPDRCGGLGSLNRHALTFTYFLAVCALGLVLLSYRSVHEGRFAHELTLQAGILVYLLAAPYCFFATLGTAHRAMKRAKDALLRVIADQFQVDYAAAQRSLPASAATVKNEVEKIGRLKGLYETTEHFPVWPLDWPHLRNFGGAVLTPLIGVVLPQLGGLVPYMHNVLAGPTP